MQKGDKTHLNFIVSDKVYTGFLNTFNDRNPLHTNHDYAVSKGFRSCVMHGNILNGFLSYFIGECLPTKDVVIHSQQINYNLPVYLNDELTFDAELSEIHEAVNAYEFKFHFTNTDGIKVARGKIQIGLT
jgi:3-hydroxybutyryl-CoA dehydratase